MLKKASDFLISVFQITQRIVFLNENAHGTQSIFKNEERAFTRHRPLFILTDFCPVISGTSWDSWVQILTYSGCATFYLDGLLSGHKWHFKKVDLAVWRTRTRSQSILCSLEEGDSNLEKHTMGFRLSYQTHLQNKSLAYYRRDDIWLNLPI